MTTASQLPETLNLEFRRGDAFEASYTLGIDITGHDIECQVSSAVNSSVITEPTVTVIDAESGEISIAITSQESADIQAGTYLWNLVVVMDGSQRLTALDGIVEVHR